MPSAELNRRVEKAVGLPAAGLVWLCVRILFPRDQLDAVVVALERASRPEAA
jgi:hypothetical protein